MNLTQAALAALRLHWARQREERLRLGAAWRRSEMVFTDYTGQPIDATKILRNSFAPLLKRTGLLGRGVHPKIVSEMPGHSQIGIALDLYRHVTPTMQREATAAMYAIVSG